MCHFIADARNGRRASDWLLEGPSCFISFMCCLFSVVCQSETLALCKRCIIFAKRRVSLAQRSSKPQMYLIKSSLKYIKQHTQCQVRAEI